MEPITPHVQINMNFLVLGSSGQIGKPLVNFLRKKGHNVTEWDITNSETQDLRLFNPAFRAEVEKCDFVYYLAFDVGGAKYLEKEQNSIAFITNNMLMMSYTFRALQDFDKPFIFTSSQMSELQHSTYGQLKLLGERITDNINGLTVRLWNVYGEEYDYEKSHVITDFIRMAKNDKKIVMRTDGTESRQLLYVDDCVECLLLLAEQYPLLNKKKNYHITSFEWSTIKEVSTIVSELANNCEIVVSKNKDKTQMNAMNLPDKYILNYWKPKTSLREGIKQVFEKLS